MLTKMFCLECFNSVNSTILIFIEHRVVDFTNLIEIYCNEGNLQFYMKGKK